MEITPNFTDCAPEIICQIFKYLPLTEVLSLGMLCKNLSIAVEIHLSMCKTINFCEGVKKRYMPSSITDEQIICLLRKCPQLETIYGLHPVKIERRRLCKRSVLTIHGTIRALRLCSKLKAIEISDIKLLEAVMRHLPHIEIIGHFKNREGTFPPSPSQCIKLHSWPKLSSLHLIGVEVPELSAMPFLEHLQLECVRFTKLHPFRGFLAVSLKSFVMKHCIGPSAQRYLSLIIALSAAPNLSRLELVRVPLPNGLFQRAVEDSYREGSFVNIKILVISACKGLLESDLGYLMVVAKKNLETLYIQPSLTKDSLFVCLQFGESSFPKLRNIHLGFIDSLICSGEWSEDALLSVGLAEVPDAPSSITDTGMKAISQIFPNVRTLKVSNCPHLILMNEWLPEEGHEGWSELTDLILRKCHCLQLQSFMVFLARLKKIENVLLDGMFREPPKGCSHVGLSAGTGLGMSSAVVSNQDEHIAVHGHQQDLEPQGDDENGDPDREFIDIEEEIPEAQYMFLHQEFFDDDDDDDDVAVDDTMEESEDLEPKQEQLDNHPNSYNLRPKYENNSARSVCEQNGSLKITKRLDSEESPNHDKALVKPEVMNCNDVQDYDPHKPSTSKAGRHLDYYKYKTDAAKSCNLSDSDSDSDYKHSLNSNKLKKSSSKQSSSKVVKKRKITNLNENNLSAGNCLLKNDIDPNSDILATDSPSHSRNYYFSDENFPQIRTCKVILTRLEIPNLSSETEIRTQNSSKGLESVNSSINNDNEPLPKYRCTENDSDNQNKILINGNSNQNGSIQNNTVNKCNESVHSSYNMKPCYVLINRIEDYVIKTALGSKTDTKREIPHNRNMHSRNENLENWPSTSTFENNRNKFSRKSSRYKTKLQSPKCEISDEPDLHSNNDSTNQTKSKFRRIKNDSENDNPSSVNKRVKKSVKGHDDEFNYYAVVPKVSNGSVEIVNSSTNESFKIPNVSISIFRHNIENSNELHPTSKVKTTCEKLDGEELKSSSDYNPYLPSTSKDQLNMECDPSVDTVCHKCPFTDRRGNKKLKKCLDVERKKEKDDIKCKNKKMTFSPETYNSCHNSSLDLEIEKLRITDSDADILMQSCHVRGNSRFNSNAELSCNSNANNLENILIGSHSDEELKKEISNVESSSEYQKDINAIVSKYNNSSEDKLNPATHPDKKSRNKKSKLEKISKILSVKSDSLEGNSTGRMVTMISRGVQATSADIRHSARCARRQNLGPNEFAKCRHKSKYTSSPHKISSKKTHKRYPCANPQSVLEDKPTSTSDPLLEDDAVLTLHLTSNTLLYFTMVSCGISHLIVGHCPKLSHIEAQACRIFKNIEINTCPVLKDLVIRECPKLSIDAVVNPLVSLTTTSDYVSVCFEPCMQNYHPGEGEKAIFSKAPLHQSVLICHDFSEVSNVVTQSKFIDKLKGWLHHLRFLHQFLKIKPTKDPVLDLSWKNTAYPWSHDPHKIFGKYSCLAPPGFCVTEGQYQLVTNNPIIREIYETSELDTEFPTIGGCEAFKDSSLLSYEAVEKYMCMSKRFIAFYIPITEINQINNEINS